MRIENLLVEEIAHVPSEESASLAATLWEFGERRWVSAQPGVEGSALGPMTVLDPDAKSFDTQTAKLSSFKPYPLHVSGKRPAISHKTIWTVDPETVYALVLPRGFVAEQLSVVFDGDVRQVEQGASATRNLFGDPSKRISVRNTARPNLHHSEAPSIRTMSLWTKCHVLGAPPARPRYRTGVLD